MRYCWFSGIFCNRHVVVREAAGRRFYQDDVCCCKLFKKMNCLEGTALNTKCGFVSKLENGGSFVQLWKCVYIWNS